MPRSKSQTARMGRPPKQDITSPSGVQRVVEKLPEEPVEELPKYDQLRIPVSALDWQFAGKFLRSDGIRDREIEKQFNDLLEKGYRVNQWQVDGASVYIFFEQE